MSYTISYFYRFGDFAIDLEQRVLLRGKQPVALTPKVFDTLLVLVERHGRIVSKDELMNLLWPDSFVEDSNLIFNVQHLRKALGDDARHPVFIETIARRGYRFIADVEECLTDEGAVLSNVKVRSAHDEYSETNALVTPSSGTTEAVLVESNAKGASAALAPVKLLRSHPITVALATSILLVASISAWYLAPAKSDHRRWLGVGTNATASRPLKVEKLTVTDSTSLTRLQ
jgi:DNA-binding winged helix-turn-helix (wHTH) protein